MVNDSRSPIPQVEEKKRQYTDRDIRRDDWARGFQNITGQPVNRILHAVDNKILHNLPILREDVDISEDIFVPSMSHL